MSEEHRHVILALIQSEVDAQCVLEPDTLTPELLRAHTSYVVQLLTIQEHYEGLNL